MIGNPFIVFFLHFHFPVVFACGSWQEKINNVKRHGCFNVIKSLIYVMIQTEINRFLVHYIISEDRGV